MIILHFQFLLTQLLRGQKDNYHTYKRGPFVSNSVKHTTASRRNVESDSENVSKIIVSNGKRD